MQDNIDKRSKRKLQLMLDNLNEKFRYKSKRSLTYVNTMNGVIKQFNDVPSSLLATIPSHQFYNTIRNLIRDLLIEWNSSYKLYPDETYLFRNGVLLLHRFVDIVEDVTVLSSWLLDPLLINAIADCMSNIDRLLSKDQGKDNFKQLTRLLDLFSTYYQRLPFDLRNDNRFNRLFEATMDCLTSLKYDRLFRKLKPNAKSMRKEEIFFLIKCPSFLSTNYAIQSNTIIEQLLETMVPRYASILDKHLRSITEWNSAMIHAVHHLLLTIISVKGHYIPYANGQPFQWLIDHIVRIISESTIMNKVTELSTTPETLLIDSSLRILTAFVHDPDLLIYIKQRKIQTILYSFILLPYESIVFHAYIVLSYIMDEDDIKTSEKESGRLLSNIFDSLRKNIKSLEEKILNEELIEHNITLLVEAIQVLVQHDQIKSEILKQNALPLLINNYQRFNDKSQRLILESLGSMAFDAEAAQLLRTNTQFLSSIENIQETTTDGLQKAAEKIIWNLIKEPEKVAEREEKIKKKTTKSDDEDEDKLKKDEYEYNIMISYCHADKELVYRIHRFLADQGFKIWIDRDHIYGPAMQAMAEAVENSEFIILCMSDSYKRSVYCQAEAEYAFHCKRRLIPLIVRQEYRPDGWLGLLLGSRIYINFGRLEFKKACESILNEITLQRKSQLNSEKNDEHPSDDEEMDPRKAESSDQPIPSIAKVHLSREYMARDTSDSRYYSISLDQWMKKDVLDFLYDSKLYSMMPLCESLNGHGLYKFFQMCQRKPTQFYRRLNEELRARFDDLLPIGIFTQFLTEVEQIIDSLSQLPTQNIKYDAIQSKPLLPSPPNVVKNGTTTPVSTPSPPNVVRNGTTTPVSISSPPNVVRNGTTTPVSPPSPPNVVKNGTMTPVSIPSPPNVVRNGTMTPVSPPSSPNVVKNGTTTPVSTPSPPNVVRNGPTTPVSIPSPPNVVRNGTTTPVPISSPPPSSTSSSRRNTQEINH